jgi:hypothetical protein
MRNIRFATPTAGKEQEQRRLAPRVAEEAKPSAKGARTVLEVDSSPCALPARRNGGSASVAISGPRFVLSCAKIAASGRTFQVIRDASPISGTRRSRGNKESRVANVRQRTYCDVHLS